MTLCHYRFLYVPRLFCKTNAGTEKQCRHFSKCELSSQVQQRAKEDFKGRAPVKAFAGSEIHEEDEVV